MHLFTQIAKIGGKTYLPGIFPQISYTKSVLLKLYTTLTDVMYHAPVGAWDRQTNEVRFPPKLSLQRALLAIVTLHSLQAVMLVIHQIPVPWTTQFCRIIGNQV